MRHRPLHTNTILSSNCRPHVGRPLTRSGMSHLYDSALGCMAMQRDIAMSLKKKNAPLSVIPLSVIPPLRSARSVHQLDPLWLLIACLATEYLLQALSSWSFHVLFR